MMKTKFNFMENVKKHKKCFPDWTGKCRFCKTLKYINANDDCEYLRLIGGNENDRT